MSGLAIAIATRGIVCCKQGTAVVTALVPDAQPQVLEPEVQTGDKGAPKVKVDATQPGPGEMDIKDTLAPQLNVTHTAPPVPDAKPKKPQDEPSAKIRPLEDLAPTIIKKNED
jgi:hypothetical protein